MSASGKVWLIGAGPGDVELPTQRSVVSRLDPVIEAVASEGLASPALVVLGEVVKFAATQSTSVMQEISRKQA